MNKIKNCYLCEGKKFDLLKKISKKPYYETEFNLGKSQYLRSVKICKNCNVYINDHIYNLEKIYFEQYDLKTYANEIEKNYNKIVALPYMKSDNKQRVARIVEYLKKKELVLKNLNVLDIGSGLGVFPAQLISHKAKVSCIEPSLNSIKHLKKNIKAQTVIHGDFLNLDIKDKYNFITMNKVLEHVKNPVKMLTKAKSLLKSGGLIYIELPDGENALKNGNVENREEFFIDHYTIFNLESLKYLVSKSKLTLEKIDFIHEPSDKYTIYCFLSCSET